MLPHHRQEKNFLEVPACLGRNHPATIIHQRSEIIRPRPLDRACQPPLSAIVRHHHEIPFAKLFVQGIDVAHGRLGRSDRIITLVDLLGDGQVIIACGRRHELPHPGSIFVGFCIRLEARFCHRKVHKQMAQPIAQKQLGKGRDQLGTPLQRSGIKASVFRFIFSHKSYKLRMVDVRGIDIELFHHIAIAGVSSAQVCFGIR